jgi:hypothetical protein
MFRVLVLVALAAGSVAVLAPAASASVPATSKTCAALNTLDKELQNINPGTSKKFDYKALGQTADAFHKAAKSAPRALKAAMNTIGDVFADISNADSASGALAEYGRNAGKYIKALATYGKYVTEKCGSAATSS